VLKPRNQMAAEGADHEIESSGSAIEKEGLMGSTRAYLRLAHQLYQADNADQG
jgi:hypothetical protein